MEADLETETVGDRLTEGDLESEIEPLGEAKDDGDLEELKETD